MLYIYILYVIRFLLYFNGKFNWYTELIIHLVKLRLSKNVISVSDWMPQKWTILLLFYQNRHYSKYPAS